MGDLRNLRGLATKHASDDWVAGLYASLDVAAQTADLYRRIYDPAQSTNTAYFTASGNDALLLPALYCRELPLDAGYAQQLVAGSTAGGASALSALRALLMLRDNNCDAGLLPAELAAIQQAVIQAFDTNDGNLDANDIEAAALLAAMGRADIIPAAWIADVLATELAAGGWAASTPVADNSGVVAASQSSVLALWLLKELAEGDNRFGRLTAR